MSRKNDFFYLFSAKFCSQFPPKLTRKTLTKFILADYAFVSESSKRIVVDGLDLENFTENSNSTARHFFQR